MLRTLLCLLWVVPANPLLKWRTAPRAIALLAVVATALTCSGCGRLSNNKGKIEGKWKLIGSSNATELENAALKAGHVAIVMEFTTDEKVIVSVEVPGVVSDSVKGSYTLLLENFIQLSDFPGQKEKVGGALDADAAVGLALAQKRGRIATAVALGALWGKEHVRATIVDDEMELATLKETLKFVRVK